MNREIVIQEIFENAKNDPSLFSAIDVDELLDKIENETTEYLENKTLKNISEMIYEILNDYEPLKNVNEKESIQK
jgi:sugar-specific transcriptional regulator TrmB